MSAPLGNPAEVITVSGTGFHYPIEFDNSSSLPELYPALAARILSLAPSAGVFALLSDDNTSLLFAPSLASALSALLPSSRRVIQHVFSAGESSKSRAAKAHCEDTLLAHRCGRDTVIIALGGGVIGDLAGFIAATYMRGVPCIQIPTTLLAMVDSAIGGKTAIDTAKGKNLIGAFHHPLAVLLSPLFLTTLPLRELSNGMAEVIKTGLIAAPALFALCEASAAQVLTQREPLTLRRILHDTARVKAAVVSADPQERWVRAVLNAGHTLGHGLEALATPDLLHGEAVSVGLVLELEIAARTGALTDVALVERAKRVLRAYKLPVETPAHLTTGHVIAAMGVDKKNVGGNVRSVLLRALGDVALESKGSDSDPTADASTSDCNACGNCEQCP